MSKEPQPGDITRVSDRSFSQRATALLLAVVLALQSGCAVFRHHRQEPPAAPVTYEAPDTRYQTSLRKVAILTSAQATQLEFEGTARGRGEGAAVNVGHTIPGLLGCGLAFLIFSGLIGEYWGAVCLIPIPFLAAAGAVKAPSNDEIVSSEAALSAALSAEVIRDNLHDEIVADAQARGIDVVSISPQAAEAAMRTGDYRSLAAQGVDSVIEANLYLGFADRSTHFSASELPPVRLFVGDSSDSFNPPLQLMLNTDVQVIRTRDNSKVFSETYAYRGQALKFTEWGANQAALLTEVLHVNADDVAQNVTDRIHLLYPFPFRMAQGELASCGLTPADPGNGSVVADLHPSLSWQSFPRESDITAAPRDMKRIQNVRYDLIIATGGNSAPPEVVYRREGLTEPSHKVEIQLRPGIRYFWSTRARFKLDGRERVTEWATQCPFEQQLVIGAHLYRFHTPKQAGLSAVPGKDE